MVGSSQRKHYRWIIVGAGPCGSVLARHLADRDQGPVALIEAGGPIRDPRARVPAWYLRTFGRRVDWNYQTVAQAELANRSIRWPRGRGLGGSSSINALIYMAPAEADLRRFAELTGSELFNSKRLQSWLRSNNAIEPLGHCPMSDVPVSPIDDLHPWSIQFLELAASSGLNLVTNWTQAESNRCGAYQLTAEKGRRVTASDVLQDHLPGMAIDVITGSFVERITFSGTRATGIAGIDEQGNRLQLMADEVILSAGAIGSPLLLQRSGVGCGQHLSSLGIPCLVDQPAVGENLQDHLVFPFVFEWPKHHSLPGRFGRADRQRFRREGRGPMASNLAEAGAMISRSFLSNSNSDNNVSQPFLQLHVTPTHYLKHPIAQGEQHSVSIACTPLHPHSRGYVRLQDAELHSAPEINPRYLSQSADRDEMLEILTWLVDWTGSSPWMNAGIERVFPNPKRSSTEALLKALRTFAMTIYHPVGTCQMGPNNDSVVDDCFQVRGTSNLRVVDLSILPELPSGNTMATGFLLARLAADRIGAAGDDC